jgi:hypothetical protein
MSIYAALFRVALANVYSAAEERRKAGDFPEAEEVLQWAWQTALETHDDHEAANLGTTMLELGELYRKALMSKDGSLQEFGRKGILLDAGDEDQSRFAPVAEVAGRYVELSRKLNDTILDLGVQKFLRGYSGALYGLKK